MIPSLKTSITYHLVGQKPFQIVVVKDIVYMLTSSQSRACKIQGVAKALGVNRHNIKKAMEMRLQLNTKKDVF